MIVVGQYGGLQVTDFCVDIASCTKRYYHCCLGEDNSSAKPLAEERRLFSIHRTTTS